MDNKSKYPPIYWEEFSPTIINKYSLKETKKGEFHGPCLVCGGKDRFWIYKKNNGELGVNCRQCGDFKGIFDEMRVDGALPTLQEYERGDFKYEPKEDFKPIELTIFARVSSCIKLNRLDQTSLFPLWTSKARS